MILNAVIIVLNIAYYVIMNIDLYTDRAMMPDGGYREWKRSPITRLHISGQETLLYFQVLFAAVSVICCILVLLGVRSSVIKTLRIVSAIASTVLFIIIMVVTSNTHVNYA